MTPFVRWLRKLREKTLGTFFEGPEPPKRLRDLAIMFAETHPNATREAWVEFAGNHAEEAYKLGYVRGIEYTERAPEIWEPDISPEAMADAIDPEWINRPIQLTHPEGVVPEEMSEHELMSSQLDAMVEKWRTSGLSK